MSVSICIEVFCMRTTLDLPEDLINEAMKITHISTKTDLIKTALANLITKERIKDLKKYYGKVDLDINLDVLRKR
jgi:Arc/MetJ family transcription regulator